MPAVAAARETREPPVADAAGYDAWYGTGRGAWIGDIEFHLLQRLLRPERGETLLEIGCGTGYFTRRFAGESGVRAVGLDPNPLWLDQMLRATRKRFAIGLLNRRSLRYLQKGRHGGSGAYRGGRWNTARGVEFLAAGRLPFGAFIVLAGDVGRQSRPIM